MPSSYRRSRSMATPTSAATCWTDWDDVFASIANYFKEYGWETGGPVVVPASSTRKRASRSTRAISSSTRPSTRLNAQGRATSTRPAEAATPALLVSAEQQLGPAYRVGFKNFNVITRYNRSARYAMAVNDLAEALAERMRSVPPTGVAAVPATGVAAVPPP